MSSHGRSATYASLLLQGALWHCRMTSPMVYAVTLATGRHLLLQNDIIQSHSCHSHCRTKYDAVNHVTSIAKRTPTLQIEVLLLQKERSHTRKEVPHCRRDISAFCVICMRIPHSMHHLCMVSAYFEYPQVGVAIESASDRLYTHTPYMWPKHTEIHAETCSQRFSGAFSFGENQGQNAAYASAYRCGAQRRSHHTTPRHFNRTAPSNIRAIPATLYVFYYVRGVLTPILQA